ncbi:MAG: serine hydrolase, partial [Polyangiales bacterium]
MSIRLSAAAVVVALAPFACGAPARDPSQCASSSSSSSPSSLVGGDGPTPTTADAAVTRLLSAPEAQARWFSPAFLAAVPIEKIRGVVGDMRAHAGAFVSIASRPDSMTVRFERGRSVTRAAIDSEGRFTTLWFGPTTPLVVSFDETVSRWATTAKDHSLLVTTDGKDRVALDADRPLPVGSAFKLAVLATLRDQIDHKKRKWTDVARLSEQQKSLPSGTLQTWPDGAPLTLYALAASMISVSDNTATDTLVHLLGRAAIEPRAPHARPLLTTREMFTLKAVENASLLTQWRAADEAGKRALLETIDAKPLPSAIGLLVAPTALDVEWY